MVLVTQGVVGTTASEACSTVGEPGWPGGLSFEIACPQSRFLLLPLVEQVSSWTSF